MVHAIGGNRSLGAASGVPLSRPQWLHRMYLEPSSVVWATQ
jgi:hypothetical protein